MINQHINFDFDTGSSIILVSVPAYHTELSSYELANNKIAVKTYANENIMYYENLVSEIYKSESCFVCSEWSSWSIN